MKHKLKIVVLGLLLGIQSFAQEKLSLTLKDAQNYALEHNRTLKNASLSIREAEAARWQSLSAMLPQVDAGADYSNNLGHKLDLSGNKIAMPPSGTFSVTASIGASVSQIIGIKLNDISVKMADISRKQTEQQTVDQVKTLYYSILVMHESVGLLEKNLENLHQLFKHTEQSVEVGVAEQIAADQISVQIVTMETNIRSSKRSLEMLYNSLRLQMGVDVFTEISLSQNLPGLMDTDNALSLLNLDFILDKNYDYQLMQQNVEQLKTQVNMKKWAYAPSLSAYYRYTKIDYFSDESTFNMTPPNSIGATLSIPIFSSGNRSAALKETKLKYEAQLNTLADTEESLNIQHRQLCYNLSSAYDSFEAQKKNVEVSQRVFDNITRKYEHGMASSMDVTDASTNVVTAQNSYVQSLLEIVSAQIDLEQLLNVEK